MTFNEFIPELFQETEKTFIDFMFEDFAPDISEKLKRVLNSGELGTLSLDVKFRSINGDRTVNNDLISNSIIQAFLTDGVVADEQNQRQVLPVVSQYKWYKWRKLLDNVYLQTYKPIENYDSTEEETLEYQGSENETVNRTSTDEEKNNSVSTSNSNVENASQSQKNVFAFNSTEPSPSDSDSGSTKSTGTNSTTDTQNSESTTTGNEVKGKTFTDRKDVRTKKTHGNIGVTTSQQMLESEIELRLKHDFINQFFADLCDIFFNIIY